MDKHHEALSVFEARLHEQHIGFSFSFFFHVVIESLYFHLAVFISPSLHFLSELIHLVSLTGYWELEGRLDLLFHVRSPSTWFPLTGLLGA